MKTHHKQLAKTGFCVILFFIAFFLPAQKVAYAQNSPSDTSGKDIIVVFKKKPTLQLLSAVSNAGGQNLEPKGGIANTNAMVYSVAADDLQTAIKTAAQNPNVAAVFPNYKLHLLSIPNDPQAQAAAAGSVPRPQWNLFNLNLAGSGRSAWDLTTGASNVVVAVIDTGVQSDHADFRNSDGSSKFSSLVDCTGNNCQEVTSLTDNNAGGHGTAVAGLVAAATNNSNGMAGTGYNTKIMAIRIVGTDGSPTQDRVINAIIWAADRGARVINLSVGIIANNIDEAAIRQYDDAIAYASGKGAVVVAAAGNCGGNTQGNDLCAIYGSDQKTITGYAANPKLYPAAASGVISVAALTANNSLAGYSEHNDSANQNIGNWVDVAAPGGDGACNDTAKTCILSTVPTNRLYWQSGTSMASPQVAGVAALIFAVNPNLTNAQVKSIIETTANNSAASGSTNFGLVNALSAVQQAGSAVTATATPTPNGTAPSVTPIPTNCVQPTPPVCTNGTLVQITPPDTGVCFKVTCVITTPTITPTAGPTATPSPTQYPVTAAALPRQINTSLQAPFCPQLSSCTLKTSGDANCDGKVDASDYNLWKEQFDTIPSASVANQNSNFMCVEGNTTTYFTDLVDFEIWRRNATGGLSIPNPTQIPGNSPVPGTQATLALAPAQTDIPLNGTQTYSLELTVPGGTSARTLDAFYAELTFDKSTVSVPASEYVDTSASGFKKIFRVDGPTQANTSGKIVIWLGADAPGAGPGTDKKITVATLKLGGNGVVSTSQKITIGNVSIADNQSKKLNITTQEAHYNVQ